MLNPVDEELPVMSFARVWAGTVYVGTREMLFACTCALTIDSVQNNILWAQCYAE